MKQEQSISPDRKSSLRDYFAGQALAGGLEQGVEHDLAECFPDGHNSWWHSPQKIAQRAYAIADAMMRARGDRKAK